MTEERLDRDSLRAVFGCFATGVTAVCCEEAGSLYGVTVNSFTSLSFTPPLALLCLVQESRVLGVIERTSRFSVNLLRQEQQELSAQLARPGGAGKMQQVATRPGRSGAPLLEGALAYLDCALHATYPGGDHTIVVGRILDTGIGVGTQAPLLFYRSAYRALRPVD